MRNSIQHFIKNGIPGLEKTRINFFKDPSCIGKCVEKIIQVLLGQAYIIISCLLEENWLGMEKRKALKNGLEKKLKKQMKKKRGNWKKAGNT